MSHAEPTTGPSGRYAIGLVVGGIIGLLAAGTLLVEKIHLLEDPDRILTCDINPVVSCGSVMTTDQAEAFGFPNPIVGIVGFTVVTTVGVLLLSGVRLPTWVLRALGLGTLFGAGFIHWLIFQSLYRIGALCPYCMVVWAVTIPLFVATVGMLVRTGAVPIRSSLLARMLTEYQAVIVTVWVLAVIGLITRRFWSYWETLL